MLFKPNLQDALNFPEWLLFFYTAVTKHVTNAHTHDSEQPETIIILVLAELQLTFQVIAAGTISPQSKPNWAQQSNSNDRNRIIKSADANTKDTGF